MTDAAHDGADHLRQVALKRSFPEPTALRSRDVFRLFTRAWPFIRPYRRDLFFLLLLLVPSIPVGLVMLVLIRVLFDVVGQGGALSELEARLLMLPDEASRLAVLQRWCVVTGVLAAVATPLSFLGFGYAIWILQRISNLFRVNLYMRLQELSLRFHSDEKIGDAIFRMFQDSAAIPQVINGLVIQPLAWFPLAVADLLWLASVNYPMALIALGLLPAQFVLAALFGAPLRRAFIREREAAALATTRIEETLASIKAVKAFGCETLESNRYAEDNWNAFIAARRARLLLAAYRMAATVLSASAYVAAVYLGVRQILAGGTSGFAAAAVSLGLFQGALALLGRISRRTQRFSDLWGSMQDVTVAISRVLEMLSLQPEERVHSGDRLPPRTVSTLRFDRVTFGYDPRVPVLEEVSLDARVGEVTAVAGASGSGKSTLIGLAVRFFDPQRGRILIDDQPADEFELEAYRGLLSVALQENPLFTASLRDNVAYGRPDANQSDIAKAVARAGLADFVRAQPAGLDTMLGEKGAKLSTGQAQRVGIARALLRDAPILLLDEPTSALDGATEEQVMRGIADWVREQPRSRIAVIATHRRTTAVHADRAYRIVAGRLVEADDTLVDAPAPGEVRDV
ncbi:MAG: ABC transporter ATP-binding protein [Candidatus Binataceae bacterium]